MSDIFLKQINCEVNFLDTEVVVGSLPAGAIITDIKCYVVTADNAGTSAVITIGNSSDVDAYEASIDVSSAGDIATTLLAPVIGSADVEVLATLVEAGTAATAGNIKVTISYIQN